MKPQVVVHKISDHEFHQEHLEWEDDTEANEEDMTQMAKCIITLVAGGVIGAATILYFLIL